MVTAKTPDLFQGHHLGAILGVISIGTGTGTGIGAAVGAWASGLTFDLSGSYRLAFILSIVSYLAGVWPSGSCVGRRSRTREAGRGAPGSDRVC